MLDREAKMSDQAADSNPSISDNAPVSLQGLTLAQAEQIDNPIVGRIIADMKARLAAKGDDFGRRSASHSSHASSPGGKGHTSYVTGKFEDS
jgi:hypothetical protein